VTYSEWITKRSSLLVISLVRLELSMMFQRC